MSNEQPQFSKPPSGTPQTEVSTGEGKVSSEQNAVIKFSVKVGRQIQQACPEIAIDYINGLSTSELVIKHDIQKKFGVTSINAAKTAVLNALGGYSGNFGDPYPGLIKDPEIYEAIGKKHNKDSGKKIGKRMKDEGRGVFAMTEEEIKQIGSRSGMNLYQTRRGIHAQTAEEKIEIGKMSVRKRGFTPFSEEEETFMKSLDLNDEQYRTRRTRVNTIRIAKEINEKFHKGNNVRSSDAISHYFNRLKKRNT